MKLYNLSSAISVTVSGMTTNIAPPQNPVKKRDTYKKYTFRA